MIQEVIDRIKAETGTTFRAVQGAAQFAAVDATPTAPAAFVIPIAESARPSNLVSATSQEIVTRIGVVTVASNRSDGRGGKAAIDSEALRDILRTALLGWQLDANHTPFEFRRGHVLGMRHGMVWWLDDYETQHNERAP